MHNTLNMITFNTCNICNICDYCFEKNQIISISLIKDSYIEGTITVALENIVGSPNSC